MFKVIPSSNTGDGSGINVLKKYDVDLDAGLITCDTSGDEKVQVNICDIFRLMVVAACRAQQGDDQTKVPDMSKVAEDAKSALKVFFNKTGTDEQLAKHFGFTTELRY